MSTTIAQPSFDLELSNKVFKMYQDFEIEFNEKCQKCRTLAERKNKKLEAGPVPIYHVGKNYSKSKIRLMLVGTVAYGWNSEVNGKWQKAIVDKDWNSLLDIQCTVEKRISEIYFNKEVVFYARIHEALKSIFGSAEIGFDNVAITNFVHCNVGDKGKNKNNENLPQSVVDICSNKEHNGWLHKEIEILNPTHVIGLTSDWKFQRNNTSIKYIAHPSARGRSVSSFINDIKNIIED